MEQILHEIKSAHESGKTVKVCIIFGTLEGCFVLQSIDMGNKPEDWIFKGHDFKLSTGRYKYNRTEQKTDATVYMFSPKLENHPRKTICFEISL